MLLNEKLPSHVGKVGIRRNRMDCSRPLYLAQAKESEGGTPGGWVLGLQACEASPSPPSQVFFCAFVQFSRDPNCVYTRPKSPSGQRLLPFVLPAHVSVQRWRILRCIPTICYLTNVSWDQSANTQCKIPSLIFSLLPDLLKNTSNMFMQNIPHHESKNRM